uniref:Sm domain-containing protein n=1 Tax=Periophthalmus magnuspinnatus TaxID=409849 RepID=A0A3B4B9Q0_9GOBI
MEESERKERKPDDKEAKSTHGSNPESAQEQAQAADSGSHDGDETDVCSEKFNPLLALYSPTVKLPFPNARCLNNLAAYESALKGSRARGAKPENVEKRRRKAMKGVVDQERIERLKKLMVNNPTSESEEGGNSGPQRRRKVKAVKNVLTRMSLCQGSPLGELNRFVQDRIRVRVHIRTFKGLRGVCSGFIVAFDRFWNMAMVDVDETYREPLLGQALYHEKALTVTRLFEKLKLQENSAAEETTRTRQMKSKDTETSSTTSKGDAPTDASPDARGAALNTVPPKYGRVHARHINQLFIRGENVVLVSPQTL